jgi:uncharacterized repeat protein (TIGR03917 family)
MTMLGTSGGEAARGLFGVARFEAGEVRDVLIPFATEEAAEAVAVEKGWSHYDVCPLRFVVREANRPADSRELFEGELARAAERTRELATTDDVPAVEPGGEEPTVVLVPWNEDEWAVVVRAGSNPADLCRVLAGMPEGLAFIEPFGEVDVVLVYGGPEAERAAAAVRELVAGAVGGEGGFAMNAGEREARRAVGADG